MIVGGGGDGRFVYSGGRLTFTGSSGLKLGAFGGSGTFTMTNGASVLTVPTISVAKGVVEQAAGTTTTTSLAVGNDSAGTGTYNLREGASLTTGSGNETVGNAGPGTFNQYGGVNTVNGVGRLIISGNSGAGTYNLFGGTLKANINLGYLGGVLRQTGGSLISGTVGVNYGSVVAIEGGDFETTDLAIGRVGGGAFNVSGGTARALGTLSVESYSTSRLLQTGGGLTVAKLTVGASGTPGGTVTLQGGLLDAATIDVRNGALTQTGGTLKAASMIVSGGAVTLRGIQDWANASTLTATGGTLTLGSDAGSAQSANLAVDVTGAAATFEVGQHLRSLHVGSGTVRSAGTLVTRELGIDGSGRLDLTGGGLVADYAPGAASPLAGVTASILAARGSGGWDGPGLTSSSATATAGVMLGYAEATDLPGGSGGMFLGEAVDSSAVLVRVTRGGDANLDGVVNFDDLLSLAKHYGRDVSAAAGGAWFNGDYTYDGVVNFDDLLVLAKNYGQTAPADAIPGTTASFQADAAAAFAQVPEPAAGALLATAFAWGWAGRRRRRS
jgi:hypothetical protein